MKDKINVILDNIFLHDFYPGKFASKRTTLVIMLYVTIEHGQYGIRHR